MCNAWNHSDGCACGFGPPYQAKVTVRRLPRPGSRNPRNAGELTMYFPGIRANYYSLLDQRGRSAVLEAAEAALQPLADRRFGEGKVRPQAAYLEKGSLEIGIILCVVGGVYKFFKDYPALKKGVAEFQRDVGRALQRLTGRIHRVYSREERRSRKEAEAERGETADEKAGRRRAAGAAARSAPRRASHGAGRT